MTAGDSDGPLRGGSVLLTRPSGQNERLAELIAAAGGKTITFPAIAIVGVDDAAAIEAAADRLHSYDFAVFVSPNAVAHAMKVIRARRAWSGSVRAVAVGRGTAQALARQGVPDAILPEARFDSEALLELPVFANVAGRRIVIFRGDGGRELLGETLAARGAHVDYVTCYRRVRPSADPQPLIDAWSRGGIDAAIITSSEGLQNLFGLLGDTGVAFLQRTPLFVPHARIAATARSLGCQRVVETTAGDEAIVAGLAEFWAKMARS